MIVKPYYNFYNDINSAGLTWFRFGAFSRIQTFRRKLLNSTFSRIRNELTRRDYTKVTISY